MEVLRGTLVRCPYFTDEISEVRAEKPAAGERPGHSALALGSQAGTWTGTACPFAFRDKVTCGNQEAVDMCACAHVYTRGSVHACVFLACTHVCPCTSGHGMGLSRGISTHLPFLHQRLHLSEVHVLQLPRHDPAVTCLQRDRA